jgi:cytochrome P450
MPLDELAYLIGTVNEGAIETTPKILRTILKAVVLHPTLAQRAQAEIDKVVGAHRLPSFEDFPQLPYTNAFVNEVIRWQPTLPLAVPHSTTTDDEYMGFRIPKGSMIISNNYRMAYNSEKYPSPFEFKPERWLENPDLQTFNIFGNGRRTCPGRHFAMKNLMIVTSRILWTYDVSPYFRDGKIVKIDPWDIRHQFTSSPGPFEVSFQVRGQDRQRIVEQEWQNAEKDTHIILETVRPKPDGA